MNSAIFVRATGTPTLRAAFGSPPTAKIQLPKRAAASSHAPTTREPDPPEHLDLEVVVRSRSPAKIWLRRSKPLAASMSWIAVVPVSFSVTAGVDALEDEERRQRDDEARQLRPDHRVAVEEADREAEQQHEHDRRPDVQVLERS